MLVESTFILRVRELLKSEQTLYEHLGPILAAGSPVALAVWQLCENAIENSQCTLSLLSDDKIWTSEMIIRSVAEGSFKVFFILTGTAEESAAKEREYMVALSDLAKLRQHKFLLSAMADGVRPDTETWMRRELLLPDEAMKIEQQYSKADRRTLIQRWSFTSIADAVASHNPAFSNLRHLAYSYSHGSQFLHQDSPALLQRWERLVMSPAQRSATNRGHATRQVTDLIALVQLRLAAVAPAFGLDPEDAQRTASDLSSELRTILFACLRQRTKIINCIRHCLAGQCGNSNHHETWTA